MKKVITIILLIALATGIYGHRIYEEIRIRRNHNPHAITVWVPFSPQHEFTNSFERLLLDWAETQDDIDINFLPITFFDYFGKIRTAQSGGVGPDVSINDIVTLPFRAQNRHVLNLDAAVYNGIINKDDYFESDIERLSYNGSLYAVPFSIDARFLFFNKDHFRDAGLDPNNPPRTLEELQYYARRLTRFEERVGNQSNIFTLSDRAPVVGNQLNRLGFHPDWGNNSIFQFAWAQGGEIFSDGRTVNWNTPVNQATMQWWVDTARLVPHQLLNAYMGVRPELFTDGVSPFATGAVSMIVENDPLAWEIETFFERHPERRFDWGVVTIPHAEGYETSWSGVFTAEVAAGLNSEREAKALRVLEFLIGPTVQDHILKYFGWKPGTISAVERVIADLDTTPQQRHILQNYHLRRHTCHNEAVPEWGMYLLGPIQSVVRGEMTVDRAMVEGQADLQNSVNRHYGIISMDNIDWFAIILVSGLVLAVIGVSTGGWIMKRRKRKMSTKDLSH
ncbi:MAG: extracellular solute-binding protein [Firmicutes bacterium]|nr:extracellular solute-binding protein [Bacillota bacterium]